MTSVYPVFGLCGFSGSGKTTVIEAVVRELTGRGLEIGVVKHDAHGLNIDREGKDTDRFFKAGANVVIHGTEEIFFRAHKNRDLSLSELVEKMGPYHDLILVEGHKATSMERKVWLCSDAGEAPPAEAAEVLRVLKRDEDRVRIVLDMSDDWLPSAWRIPPVYAGILIGGESSRFGQPKHLVREDGATWLERTVELVAPHVGGTAILGAGTVPESLRSLPVLCDAPNTRGPLAGMRAAMRWRPSATWLFLACDLPLVSEDAVRWVLDHRNPGTWAVLPQLPGVASPEPLFAHYDLRAAPLLERVRRPVDMASETHVAMPKVTTRLQASWTNVNTIDQLAAVNSEDTASRLSEPDEGGS